MGGGGWHVSCHEQCAKLFEIGFGTKIVLNACKERFYVLKQAFTLTTICACPNGCGAPPPTDPFTTTAGPGPRPDNSGSNDDGGISTGSILCIV